MGRPPKALGDTELALAHELRAAGATYQTIADHCGVSVVTVSRSLNPDQLARRRELDNRRNAKLRAGREAVEAAQHEAILVPGRLPLYRFKEVVGWTLVDEDIWERYRTTRLRLNVHTGYVTVSEKYLHREIMGLKKGDVLLVDHINRDSLDNRRANLRCITQAENAQNRIRRKRVNRYGYPGICRAGSRYEASAVLNGVWRYIGRFDTPEEAIAAAKEWRAYNVPYSPEAQELQAAA